MKKKLTFFPFLVLIALMPSSELIYFLTNDKYLEGIGLFFFGVTVLMIPIYFFRNNLRLYIKLLIPVFFLVPFNLAYLFVFNSQISDASILMLINTNKHEATELLKHYFLILGVYLVISYLVMYLLFTKVPGSISSKLAKYISIFSFSVLMLNPLTNYNSETNYFASVKFQCYRFFPGTLVYSVSGVYKQLVFIRKSQQERTHLRFFSHQDSLINDKQVHILIIGESLRYDHLGINHYSRNTTPQLSKKENLISFNNTTSCGYMTTFAVPLLLTGLPPDSFLVHSRHKSILSVFDEVGFSTYWITHQTDYSGNIWVHSLDADKSYNLFADFRSTRNTRLDIELVDTLKLVLDKPVDKKFIGIHTLGSHYSYSSRYPDEFDVYTPSNKEISSRISNKKYKQVLINSYDNSVLYTDMIIDSVINMVSRLNVVGSVTYVSDHGDDLFDADRDRCDHGQGAPPSKYVAHIPFLIWYSPKLAARFPEKIKNLEKNKNVLVSADYLFHTITSMAGINFPKQDSTKDLTSDYLKDSKRLILGENNRVYRYADLK